MAKVDLNKSYAYNVIAVYNPIADEANAINSFVIHVKKNWDSRKNGIVSFKNSMRIHLEPRQKERCAYCRQYLQASGKGEHLDHIVAKDDRPQWLFKPMNLILSCSGCNVPKHVTKVLYSPFNRRTNRYPISSTAFKIFNPYYDKWKDHFFVDDEIFIQAKQNSKGDFTIKTCELFRHQVVINNTRELRMKKTSSKKKLTHRIQNTTVGSDEYVELNKALSQIVRTS
jgi:hypothetical protein